LLLLSFASYAEPIYPVLSPAAMRRLQAQLRQSAPDTNRANLPLRLGNDVLEQSEKVKGRDPDGKQHRQPRADATYYQRRHHRIGKGGYQLVERGREPEGIRHYLGRLARLRPKLAQPVHPKAEQRPLIEGAAGVGIKQHF
jgi:hypothetical protein